MVSRCDFYSDEEYEYAAQIELDAHREQLDTPQDKLDRISYLERMGMESGLLECELNDLDRLYMEMFGMHLSEDRKRLYR